MTSKSSPYIHHTGDIIIAFNADQKYHFWNGGQQLCDTLTELNVTEDVWNRHTLKPYQGMRLDWWTKQQWSRIDVKS